ncbi:bub1-related kinase isoform 1-T2 [Glossina fuscipes fuscipes]
MNIDEAKENIQPLATGRNASVLQASLTMESSQELTLRRRELENEIHNYRGDDPLSAWYNYIDWIEQSFPSGGKESGLKQVLVKCLDYFASDERYYQDGRMIRLFIKFMDGINDAAAYYQRFFEAGFGGMVADFYISWAYSYELEGNVRKADEIFRQGIACRAQPLEDLKEAHQHFGYTVAQRLLYKENETIKEETNRQLSERRSALASLKGFHRKHNVGSVRTGSVIKNAMPGTIKVNRSTTSKSSFEQVQVITDENDNPGTAIELKHANDTGQCETVKNLITSMISVARNQENEREAGPWNKSHTDKNSGKLFRKNATLSRDFKILEDESQTLPMAPIKSEFDMTFKYPKPFFPKNKPQKEWIVPVTIEEAPDKGSLPEYKKYMLYPRPNVEFQLEELKAYSNFKLRNIENNFTKKRDIYWRNGPNFNVRQYPHFAKQSIRQTPNETYVPPKENNLVLNYDEIYDPIAKQEYEFAELYAKKIKRNETIVVPTDMEETIFDHNTAKIRRKSFLPARKSMAPSVLAAVQTKLSGSPVYDYGDITVTTQTTVNTSKRNIVPDASLQTEGAAKNQSAEPDDCIESKINSAAPFENSFKFNPPAVPHIKEVKQHAPCFDIFEDTVTRPNTKAINCKTDCPSEGFLDADESCSTQTFNLFLKAQLVSTPKPPCKTTSHRQFGTILKETVSPTDRRLLQPCMESQERVVLLNAPLDMHEGVSPFCKQLSTILETSEQGSGSTKSTISSAEYGVELQNTSSSTQKTQKEQLVQKTESPCKENMKSNSKEENIASKNVSAEPLELRAMSKTNANPVSASNFSIYEDDAIGEKNAVVNLSCVEGKEPTAECLSLKMPSIRFQEEKTETATNVLLTSRLGGGKFQEEKTETIPDILVFPQKPSKFQTDESEDFSNFFLAPPTPCKFNDDDIFDMSTKPVLKKKEIKSAMPNENDHYRKDLFEVFTDIPPKQKISLCKSDIEKFFDLELKTHKNKENVLFEDEVPSAAFYCSGTKSKGMAHTSKVHAELKDTSMPDFSIIEDKPYQQQKNDCVNQNLSKIERTTKEHNISHSATDSSVNAFSNTQRPERSNTSDDNVREKKNSYLSLGNIKINKCETIDKSFGDNETYDDEMSIYYRETPKSPKVITHLWEDNDTKTPENNKYIHDATDNISDQQFTDNSSDVNPFSIDLIKAHLEQVTFTQYIQGLQTCTLMAKIPRLIPKHIITIGNINFEVNKFINSGAYGAIYCGKNLNTGQLCALKQERPPNLWEYYICLEIQDRVFDEMYPAYMAIDYALIGNNSSILISDFSQYGSLIAVCNKIKKSTTKNMDEYVVMLLATELLEIIDHLHAANIIHADIKADNILLMNKLCYPVTHRMLQLIDFGVSIDMKLFKEGQTFSYVHNDKAFNCVEMREGRPWTYQLDLYGLAGVIHVLLYGKYMDIEKNSDGIWMHKTRIPRYHNKRLWETIFKTLLNVRNCKSMPNLQQLRALLKEEIEEEEKYVTKMINEFNRAIN